MIPMHVSFNIRNRQFGKALKDEILMLPGVSIVENTVAAVPEVFLIEDEAGTVEKIHNLRRDHPDSNIFVISSDSSPDHIVEAMKAGASEYFLAPLNLQKVREAVESVHLDLQQREKTPSGTVYAFLGSKGGLGTTVLAVNTAAALAARNSCRSALIDLSLQAGDTSVQLDLVPKTTIVDIARNFHRFDASFLAGVMEKHAAGIDLLAAPASPQDAYEISSEQVQKILSLTRRHYRSIVVDCPSMAIGGCSLEAFRAAEKIFVVTDLSVPAVRNASRMLKHFHGSGFSPQKIEVVINRYAKGQIGTLEDVEKSLGRRLFWIFPNDFDNAMASINRGAPLLKYNSRASLARSISEFTQKITEPTTFQNYRGVKGLLGKAI